MGDQAGRTHPWQGRIEIQIAVSAARSGLLAAGVAIGITGVLSWAGGAGGLLQLPMVLAVAGGAVLLLAALTIVLTLPRGPSRVAGVKHELASVYLEALDDTVLDPNRGGGR